jgi:hypothetical protein
MSIQLFFSPPEGDDAGVAVTEDTPETGAGRKARQRKQRAQCAGIVHSWTLRVNETTFTPAQRAGKHWNYSGFCMQTTVFDPQDSALTQKKLRREFSRVCPIGIHAILPRQF